MSAWVLPDHIADVLPSEARHLEELRRELLDCARAYGYELVMPPLLEHLDSLLTGTGEALDLQTFKLVDQLSGRTLGLRADTTQQVARIDAHLLNRQSVTRLSYCGSVLHTRPERPYASREPLQLGAEIYGHSGVEADLEILLLALDCLHSAKVSQVNPIHIDLTDARILKTLLRDVQLSASHLHELRLALAAKDRSEIKQITQNLPREQSNAFQNLLNLYGDIHVLDEAEAIFAHQMELKPVWTQLRWLHQHLLNEHQQTSDRTFIAPQISFDLADMRGYNYYSGSRFSIFVSGVSDALVRGGRYDEVGAVFGRNRPAVGFSLDLRELALVTPKRALQAAVRAPWSENADLQKTIRQLRQQGQTVVCLLPGHENETNEFLCDRELVFSKADQKWLIRAID